jgi:predicted ATPase
MSKIVAISGAAGTGKSTILESIKKDGFLVSDFKAARTVLNNMGKSLSEILKDENETITFQEDILFVKNSNDGILLERSPKWAFTERSTIDLYGFAKTWQSHFNSETYDDWLSDYRIKCISGMNIYSEQFIIPPGKFEHVDDGVRAKADTQDETHQNIVSCAQSFMPIANKFFNKFNYHVIDSVSVNDRLNEIKSHLDHDEKTFFIPRRSKPNPFTYFTDVLSAMWKIPR